MLLGIDCAVIVLFDHHIQSLYSIVDVLTGLWHEEFVYYVCIHDYAKNNEDIIT